MKMLYEEYAAFYDSFSNAHGASTSLEVRMSGQNDGTALLTIESAMIDDRNNYSESSCSIALGEELICKLADFFAELASEFEDDI